MAATVYLDTHAVVWLFEGRVEKLSEPVRAAIERDRLLISPMVELELAFLHEIGRIKDPAERFLQALGPALGLRACDLPFAQVVAEATRRSWTRDPFDRLIVAHAAARDAPLVTKDRTIHRHYPAALW